jgi:transcriptional regulator with XRE-family HTH domain
MIFLWEGLHMDTVGDRLRALRNSIHLSQKAIAGILGVTQSAINRYESNESEPVFRIMLWYADYFDVSMDYLFCRTDKPQGKLYHYEPSSMREKMKDKREWEQFIEACFEPGTPMNEKLKQTILGMSGDEKA